MARMVFDRDLTTVVLHNVLHYTQAQSAALAWRFGGKEWFEEALDMDGINAAAIVGKVD